MFDALTRITALPAIILGSAWVWVSKGTVDGIIFLLVASVVYGIIILIYAEIDTQRIKTEQRRE